ncbi:hypothetical protein T4B_12176 [Trichinella pseudospiralis]|uniref:Uncharacterized protein n=1 Tax=Trichinella pseudospiralis TaxID=6337 RepID=A0A0V1H1V6_TRIPS|nr:hypothetical protein T4B_12176 [Trichinella pseudospiralis]
MVGSVGWQKTALARKERVKRRGKYSAERDKIVGHLLDRTRERGCEVMGKLNETLRTCWFRNRTRRDEMVKDFVLTNLRLCEEAACTLCGSIEHNPWEKAVSVVEKTAVGITKDVNRSMGNSLLCKSKLACKGSEYGALHSVTEKTVLDSVKKSLFVKKATTTKYE